MIIGVGGEEYEFGKENAWFVQYPNDLMNGLFIDYPDNYLFFSQHFPEYQEVAEPAYAEGIETLVMPKDADLTASPHKWIVNSLVRIVIGGFEAEIEDSNG